MEHSHPDQHTDSATDKHATDKSEHGDHFAEHAAAALAGPDVVKVQPDGTVPVLPVAEAPAGDQPPAGPGADLFDTWQQVAGDGAE